jgi:hypothetical protein
MPAKERLSACPIATGKTTPLDFFNNFTCDFAPLRYFLFFAGSA